MRPLTERTAALLSPSIMATLPLSARWLRLLLVFFCSLIACGCSNELAPITDCDPVGDIRPVCGMKTPEDIAALEDGRYLLLAHFGGMEDGTGSLSLFDTQTEQLRNLFPKADGATVNNDPDWGDRNCGPPSLAKFSPHGTHLHQLDNGRWRYLVVNHGGRESIEMFELNPAGDSSALHWRGCVLAAPDTAMNDVVGLANGDLIYSRMYHSLGMLDALKGLLGFSTGDLWRWNSTTGLRVLPGTAAAQPNGLEISPDGRFVFANMYSEQEVWKIDAASGEKIATAAIANADNSAWGSDGRLLIATHTGGVAELLACMGQPQNPCGGSFEIIAMDPETMAAEVVFAHRGAPMGVATIAVAQGGRVYMGSFVGDRMISVSDFSPAKE